MRSCSTLWLAVLAVAILSCGKEGSQRVRHQIKASAGDNPFVKTTVDPSDDSRVLWSAGEHVNVFVGNDSYEFTGTNASAADAATFSGSGPAGLGTYVMLSPYNSLATKSGGTISTTLPAVQTGRAGSFTDGTVVLAGTSSTNTVTCKHVCSGIRFKTGRADVTMVTLQGNNGERIAGDFSFSFSGANPVAGAGTETVITLTAPGGGSFEADQWYYIVSLPYVFSSGITLTAYAGAKVGTLVISNENLTFSRGMFKQVISLNERMTWATTSGRAYYGPQNTFCSAANTDVVIDVKPRLIVENWQRSIALAPSAARPASADVLWGGSGTYASLSTDGTVLTMRRASDGSSLVAIKDSEGNILWSYLLWVGSTFEELTLPTGKKILPPLGGNLYFQWGRKDPLKTDCAFIDNRGTGGLDYSISNPETFIRGADNAFDWFCKNEGDQDHSLWGEGGAKTVWDPCPEGYRVPSEADFTHAGFDYSYLENNFAELGYVHNTDFYAYGRTYWTRTPSGDDSTSLDDTGYPGVFRGQTRNIASPVRCVRE